MKERARGEWERERECQRVNENGMNEERDSHEKREKALQV